MTSAYMNDGLQWVLNSKCGSTRQTQNIYKLTLDKDEVARLGMPTRLRWYDQADRYGYNQGGVVSATLKATREGHGKSKSGPYPAAYEALPACIGHYYPNVYDADNAFRQAGYTLLPVMKALNKLEQRLGQAITVGSPNQDTNNVNSTSWQIPQYPPYVYSGGTQSSPFVWTGGVWITIKRAIDNIRAVAGWTPFNWIYTDHPAVSIVNGMGGRTLNKYSLNVNSIIEMLMAIGRPFGGPQSVELIYDVLSDRVISRRPSNDSTVYWREEKDHYASGDGHVTGHTPGRRIVDYYNEYGQPVTVLEEDYDTPIEFTTLDRFAWGIETYPGGLVGSVGAAYKKWYNDEETINGYPAEPSIPNTTSNRCTRRIEVNVLKNNLQSVLEKIEESYLNYGSEFIGFVNMLSDKSASDGDLPDVVYGDKFVYKNAEMESHPGNVHFDIEKTLVDETGSQVFRKKSSGKEPTNLSEFQNPTVPGNDYIWYWPDDFQTNAGLSVGSGIGQNVDDIFDTYKSYQDIQQAEFERLNSLPLPVWTPTIPGYYEGGYWIMPVPGYWTGEFIPWTTGHTSYWESMHEVIIMPDVIDNTRWLYWNAPFYGRYSDYQMILEG